MTTLAGGGGASDASRDGPSELRLLHDKLAALETRLAAVELLHIDRYYDLPTTAGLLGTTLRGLRVLLYNHRQALSPPVYRFDKRHLRHRMLSTTDVKLLQSRRIRRRLPLFAA